MALEPGTNVGPYRIISELGRGGMATVYKAYQAALARNVAIKVLPTHFQGERGLKERFQQEAIAVANLRHRNIPAVYDYGETDGIIYIATEYIDGGTLSEQLGKPLPIEYAVEILTPVAAALDYAHSKGVLHRDVKPSNILLERDGTPVLSDFGLAKMMASGKTGLTQTGMIVGTPEYMSPEQCEGAELTPAADLYALATVAYEMLTGHPPFQAETPLAVIIAQVRNTLPPPRSINPELSEHVEQVLLKALAKHPGDRQTSCSRFVRELAGMPSRPSIPVVAAAEPPAEPALVSVPVVAAVVSAPPAPPPATPKQERRRSGPPWLFYLPGVAVVLAIAVIAGSLWLGGRHSSNPTAGLSSPSAQSSESPSTSASASPSLSPSTSAHASPTPTKSAVAPPPASSKPTSKATPPRASPTPLVIQSVTFSPLGNAPPTITVTGLNFGAEPTGVSDNVNNCGSYSANGDDFGTSFWFQDSTYSSYGYGTPQSGSCVGIIINSWSSTSISFKFGNAYRTFDHWYLTTGDPYTLYIKGAQKSGTV
jgi:eukaryotic-like serine/threonine-protein kinase